MGCPVPPSTPTQKARSRDGNIDPGSAPPNSSRVPAYSHPRNLYSHPRNPYPHPPGILIHIAPESLFTWPGICSQDQKATEHFAEVRQHRIAIELRRPVYKVESGRCAMNNRRTL